jgi:hypothetical protein
MSKKIKYMPAQSTTTSYVKRWFIFRSLKFNLINIGVFLILAVIENLIKPSVNNFYFLPLLLIFALFLNGLYFSIFFAVAFLIRNENFVERKLWIIYFSVLAIVLITLLLFFIDDIIKI